MLGLFSRDRNLVRLEVRRALNRPARATFCWGSKQAWTSGGVRASSGRDTIHARCTRLLSLPRVPAAPEALCAPPDGAAPAWSVHVTDTVSQRVGVTALTTPNPSETARRSPEGMDTQTHAHLPHTHTHRYTQTKQRSTGEVHSPGPGLSKDKPIIGLEHASPPTNLITHC